MGVTSMREPGYSALKLALLAQELRARLKDSDLLHSDPIAVIGMGCRFPGGANSPAQLWQRLIEGTDAIREVPPDRYDPEEYFDPDQHAPGKITSRFGGFMDDPYGFDPEFFGISPREAAYMDPQQRIFLEVAYEALEDAGQTREKLRGTAAGVFAASYYNDYYHETTADPNTISAYSISGLSHAFVANRLSFFLDLQGPSLTVDTACSSSLTAVHLAVQSLRSGECNLALAGGVNLVLAPVGSISLSKWGFLARDGRCKTFDARADGFIRSDGCGVVVLKRLSDALASGDRIWAVIRGAAVNQDGRSTVITSPNGLAQQAVIRQALSNGHVDPAQIGYVEAHGTGTAIGDPIEVEALVEALGKSGRPCALTSLKTHIGHAEAAAGAAGLIKAVLCLHHQAIPAHLHFQSLNPHIGLDGSRFYIPTELTPWAEEAGPRFAGVSSFGFGGTNAHIVLEEAPRFLKKSAPGGRKAYLLALSAHSESALRELAGKYVDSLAGGDLPAIGDICFTAAQRRSHYPFRISASGEEAETLGGRLKAWLELDTPARAAPFRPPKIGFVFSGQGTQWRGMGLELLEREPVFRDCLTRIDALLQGIAGWSLLEELQRSEADSRLDTTAIAQPVLFAIQMGLEALWRSWGIIPSAVAGHSLGEIAAACSAGALDLERAVALVAERGRLMQSIDGCGKMASVDLTPAGAREAIAPYKGQLSVAAINSPTTTVLSGDSQALEEAVEALRAKGVRVKVLPVHYAFHSHQVTGCADELEKRMAGMHSHTAGTPIYSTVTGKVQTGPLDAAYWGENMRRPVNFAEAVANMAADGVQVFVEIGPQPALTSMVRICLEEAGAAGSVVASLRRGTAEQESVLGALGELYCAGAPVRWEAVFPQGGKVVSLPAYAWQNQVFRVKSDPVRTAAGQAAGKNAGGHPFLGAPLRSPAFSGQLFQAVIGPKEPAFLSDHRIQGDLLVPGAVFVEMILSAVRMENRPAAWAVEDLVILRPLPLPEQGACTIQLHLGPWEGETASADIHSQEPGGEWRQHASAQVRRLGSAVELAWLDPSELLAGLPEAVDIDSFYRDHEKRGAEFGPAFRRIRQLRRGPKQALALVEATDDPEGGKGFYSIHPAVLDACLQGVNTFAPPGGDSFLPLSVERVTLLGPASGNLWSQIEAVSAGSADGYLRADINLFSEDGAPLGKIEGLVLRRATTGATPAYNRLHELAWAPVQPSASEAADLPAGGPWMILADEGGWGSALAGELEERGGQAQLVFAGPGFERRGERRWQAGPFAPQDWLRLVEEICSSAGDPAGVIDLRGLDSAAQLPEFASPVEGVKPLVGGLMHLAQALHQRGKTNLKKMMVVTRGAQAHPGDSQTDPAGAALWGLASSLALELPELHVCLVDLDPAAATTEGVHSLLEELASTDGEDRISRRGDRRLAARLRPIPPVSEPVPCRLEQDGSGMLESLRLNPIRRRSPGAGEVEIRVRAAGMNFRDVLKALGRYPDAGLLGDECAGIVTAVGPGVSHVHPGDGVVAFGPGSFATHLVTRAEWVMCIPDGFSMEETAGLPIVFMTAIYCLESRAGVKAGETVLIHSGAGGVGLAAIQVALRAGARVFATAGTPEKRAFLRSLGVEQVFDSRQTAFADEILAITQGRGVDVVLNSLAGEFIPASLSVLAPGGRFIEIGRTGEWTAEEVARRYPALSYETVYLGKALAEQPGLFQELMGRIFSGLKSGAFQSLPRRSFGLEEAGAAFRFMAAARHTGKIVLLPPGETIDTEKGPRFRPDGLYLISGGLGGLGLEVARWMGDQGARHLALVGRHIPAQAQEAVASLREAGLDVRAYAVDVSDREALQERMVEIRRDLPPLRGVIHAAGITEDGLLPEQTWERVGRVLAPKLEGTWNLHCLTRYDPLDFFVMFSALAGTLGSSGQSGYAAANSFLDGFAAWRRSQGLPALAIDWGAWLEAGMFARLSRPHQERWKAMGMAPLSAAQGLEGLGLALQVRQARLAILHPAKTAAFGRILDAAQAARKDQADAGSGRPSTGANRGQDSGFLQRWQKTPASGRRALLMAHLGELAARVIGLPAGRALDPNRPYHESGLDSLMALEMRNALVQQFNQPLPATLLFDYPTGEALSKYLTRSVPALADGPQAAPSEAAKKDDELADLSEAEAADLLAAELEKLRKRDQNA